VNQNADLRRRIGWIATLLVAVCYGGMAVSIDFATAAKGFQSDEATYHLMGHSLAADGDLTYRREDLVRAFREFPTGPAGIFLKRGTDVERMTLVRQPPFVAFQGVPAPEHAGLYYGKSFAYPLLAAPFVWLLGTNGFLLLNALLLSAAFLAIYTFAAARTAPLAALLWAAAFVFASVVPVYTIWIAPELFNWALTAIAYFLWLYKVAAPNEVLPASARLRGAWTDAAAAALVGFLTFSKVTNVLLLLPMAGWLLWTGAWRRAVVALATCGLVGAFFFGINVAISGEWNYQGGNRATCYDTFPFQHQDRGLDEVCDTRSRSEALVDIIFDREVFWTNLRANLAYFVVGRNSGLVLYYLPGAFAVLALIAAFRRSERWQWLILGSVVVQAVFFIITLPYSYFGGGGTVGNRYFIAVYGAMAFCCPPLTSLRVAAVPLVAGSLFTAGLILNPFETSIRPASHAKSGLFQYFPVELTNLNDLPLMTEAARVRIWYGDTGAGDPGFQIYYLDDNSYLQEADRQSFWIRGQSRAEILIKTDKPHSRLGLTLTAGPVVSNVTVTIHGRQSEVTLRPGQSSQLNLSLGPAFPYKKDRPTPAYVWTLAITSSSGFVPAIGEGSHDRRYLGVRVRPVILE
jgi:hypothetical protein